MQSFSSISSEFTDDAEFLEDFDEREEQEEKNDLTADDFTAQVGKGVIFVWVIPLILSTFGIVVISSATGWGIGAFGFKQTIWLLVALLLVFPCMLMIPLKFWYRWSGVMFVASCVLMLLTLFSPFKVATAKGVSRWLRCGPIVFQPLELLSFSIMLCLPKIYRSTSNRLKGFFYTVVLLIWPCITALLQPDFGGLIMLAAIVGMMYTERYGFLAFTCIVVPAVTGIILFLPYLKNILSVYQWERVAVFMNPWYDPRGSGYQVIQGLLAFANGGMWGIGMGRMQGFLPENHNDFIFATIGEQFGLMGTGGVFVAFMGWTAALMLTYYLIPEDRRLPLWGCCISILLPLFINLGGVLKIIPLTGMPLPFLSYGGSSLIMMWARIGLLVRLIREP